jgi:hypothetical protein
MIEVFKIINGIYDPLTTVDTFELNTTSNTRGHSKKMKIKQVDCGIASQNQLSRIKSYVYACRTVIFALLVLPVLI